MPITTRRTLEPSAAIDESYRYQPLNTDRPAFRLLRLRKGYWTPIECDILHESLDQPTQPYEALSYTWGNPDRNQRISVNGSTLAITSSLLWTLIHLRYKDEDRILWIDGICIDQTNLVERGHQVQQMGDIYRSAERVIFWLGRATDQIAILMHSIQLFEEESNSHECSDWKLNDPRWATLLGKVQSKLQVRYQELLWTQERGLKTLLSRPWFTRVWIVQEVANARSGLICCGTSTVSSRLFALMPRLLDIPTDQLSQAVLDMLPGPLRLETWWADERDLYSLLRYLGPRQSSEPRDIIYSLRGISTDANTPGTLDPNYEISCEVVLRQVSQHLYFCDVNSEKRRVDSVEDLAADVVKLNSAAIGELIKTSQNKGLDVVSGREGTVISADTVRTASKGGKDWMQLLRYVVGRGVSVLPDALPEAAYRGDSATLEMLLARCKRDDIKLQILLECAALNEQHGPGVISTLAQRGEYLKPNATSLTASDLFGALFQLPEYLRPTATTWIASSVNPVSGPQVREALLDIWGITYLADYYGIRYAFQTLISEDPFQFGHILYNQQLGSVWEILGHPPMLSRSHCTDEGFFWRAISRYRRGFTFLFALSIPAAVLMVGARFVYDMYKAVRLVVQIGIDSAFLSTFQLAVIFIHCLVTIRRGLGRLRCPLVPASDRGDVLKWGDREVRCFLKHKIASAYLTYARLREVVVKRFSWWFEFKMFVREVMENLLLLLVSALVLWRKMSSNKNS